MHERRQHSSLAVSSTNLSFVQDALLATSRDFKPKKNSKPFGKCSAERNPDVIKANGAPQPCIHATLTPWSDANPTIEIDGLPVLSVGKAIIGINRARIGLGRFGFGGYSMDGVALWRALDACKRRIAELYVFDANETGRHGAQVIQWFNEVSPRIAVLSHPRFNGQRFGLLLALSMGCQGTHGHPGDTRLAISDAPSSAASTAPISAQPRPDNPTNDDLEIFLEAARSDIQTPYSRPAPDVYGGGSDEQRLADARYRQAATRVLDEPLDAGIAASTIARVLAQTSDPRGPAALVEWAMRPTTHPFHVSCALTAMRERPLPEYLPVIEALLENDHCARDGPRVSGIMNVGLFSEAVGLGVHASACAVVLSIAAGIHDDRARGFLREVAMDRRRSDPTPNAYERFACCHSKCNRDEARALSSTRLMALALLNDKSLATAIASDRTESAFIRRWAHAMAGGETALVRARRKQQHDRPAFWVSPCPPLPDGP